MKSKVESVANVLAVAIWADGVYSEEEQELVKEIAECYEFNATKFATVIESALGNLENMDEEQLSDFLNKASEEINDEEREVVFEGVLELTLADSVVDQDRVERLLDISYALGIDTVEAVVSLLGMCNEDAENLISEEAIANRLEKIKTPEEESAEVLKICSEIYDKETCIVEL